MEAAADFSIDDAGIRCQGSWTAANLRAVEQRLSNLTWTTGAIRFDLEGVENLDTAGAWLIFRTRRFLEQQGRQVVLSGASPAGQELIALVGGRSASVERPAIAEPPGILETAGEHTVAQLQQYLGFLGFIGQLAHVIWRGLTHPWHIRWAVVAKELQAAGVNALPIVGLLTFLIGIVIAYQGGIVLRDYGANLYVADIVGLSMVRELAPLITAIIVAGRTGSAYTAQIGTMMVTEEVDALRSIGISPMEMLVLPKLVALVIALPLLTVFADAMGLFGGLIMANSMLNLNPTTFLNRLAEALTLNSYLSGIGKAPVFAAIIAAVGCFQGFRVYGSAGSVGRQTTISVVQSIFLVIIVDAAFSVAFAKLGI